MYINLSYMNIFMGVHYILYMGVEDILEFLPSDCDKNNLCPKPDQVIHY